MYAIPVFLSALCMGIRIWRMLSSGIPDCWKNKRSYIYTCMVHKRVEVEIDKNGGRENEHDT